MSLDLGTAFPYSAEIDDDMDISEHSSFDVKYEPKESGSDMQGYTVTGVNNSFVELEPELVIVNVQSNSLAPFNDPLKKHSTNQDRVAILHDNDADTKSNLLVLEGLDNGVEAFQDTYPTQACTDSTPSSPSPAQEEEDEKLCAVSRRTDAIRLDETVGKLFFYCPHCKTRIFGTKNDLQKHQKDHLKTRVRPHKCLLCPKTYLTKSHLRDHGIRAHTTEKLHECEICHRLFSLLGQLEKHSLQRHREARPFQCTKCGAAFKLSSALRNHSFVHITDKVFTCSVCAKTFSRADSCARHERGHSGVKRRKCSTCGKEFRCNDSLKEHEVVHSDARPFNCIACSKSFKTIRLLKMHLKAMHNVTDTSTVSQLRRREEAVEVDDFEFESNSTCSINEVDPLAGAEPEPEVKVKTEF